MMIAIVDYGMGNLRSVLKKFENLKINAIITGNRNEIEKANKLIIPGVGHFSNGMKNLRERNLLEILHEKAMVQHTPVLGICLGMQLMAGYSEEGNCPGLGWFDASVVRFKVSDKIRFKVPHIGWNQLLKVKPDPLTNGISPDDPFYFVHSYHMKCNIQRDILYETDYEYTFTSAVQRNNLWGVQFHPEKSHAAGELMLGNFAKI